MPRPPRLEYPDAICHVTARGVHQAAIFLDDRDRATLIKILAKTLRDCDARVFAFCLMGNHYHFVLQTHQANLSVLMRRVNSLYSLTFNQRHGRHGHLFEGRFFAVHVDRDAYLLEVCRYVDLNPVRAGLIQSAAQWAWSSHRAHTGSAPAPSWLATSELHGMLMGQVPEDDAQIAAAERRYAQFVEDGRGTWLWKASLRQGAYLGNEAFVERVKARSVSV